ncbi:MAG: translocation and assembly module protein TamB, partial [Paracoccaceae bacterium]
MRVLALLLFCLLTPLAAWAQQDQGDRGYIQGLLEDALSAPGRTVRIEGFAGALSSRATIDKITVTDPEGVWLTATDLALSWSRTALLKGAIEIDEISIGRIDLPRAPVPAETTLPSPEAQAAFTLPELPVSVDIAKLAIARTVLGAPILGQEAELSLAGSAALSGGAGTAKLTVERLDKSGSFALSGGFDNTSRVLTLDLSLEEPAGGIAVSTLGLPGQPALQLAIAGKDPIGDFTATLRLATDGKDRLTGTATLITDAAGANRFALDIGGDVAPVLLPEFAGFLGDRVALKAEGARDTDGALALDTLRLATAAMQLDGSARIGADGWPRKLALDGRIAPVEGDIVILPLPGPRTSVTGVTFTAGFDDSAGEAWSIAGRMTGFARPDLTLATAGFTGAGRISRGEGWVTGQVQLDARGLAPTDPALARALGDNLRGRFGFD